MNVTYSYTRCRFGVATRDVTPPIGIYARSWGAATHEVAEGVHRPFAATAAVFAPVDGEEPTLALVAVDLGWFQYVPDERNLRAAILEATGLDDAALLINMSHTHGGANVNSQLQDKPGGELIEPYLAHLTEQLRAAILEARASLAPAWVTYGTGRCALAANRDLWDTEAGRFAVGYNPGAPADDTLLVARVTGEDGGRARRSSTTPATRRRSRGRTAALAGLHRCRARGPGEHVRRPGAFPAGRFGRARPARQPPVGETSFADSNGRQLGHAAAAAIESLPPPGTRFVYTGIVASGANLGTWAYEPCDAGQLEASEQLAARVGTVELRRKEDIGVVEPLTGATPDSVQEREKALRRRFLAEALGDGPVHEMPLWTWRLGDALLVAIPNEPYSVLQVELRRRLAATPCSSSARPTGRWATSRPRRPTAPGSTRSSSRRSRPAASSRRSRSPRARSRSCEARNSAGRPPLRGVLGDLRKEGLVQERLRFLQPVLDGLDDLPKRGL